MSVWKYLVRFSWRNLTRNRLMNIVALGTTAMALLVTSGVLLVQQNISLLINQMKEETPVIVYLEDGLEKSRVNDLQSRLITRKEVNSVNYRSKQAALRNFRQRLGPESNLLSGLSRNPLPASLHVSLKPEALGRIEALAGTITEWSGVESVDYGKEIVERLQGLGQVIQAVLAIIGVIICVVAVFIIFNTIQLSVVSCSTEIDILKLVGATRWFIGFPFVVGGVVHGLLGSLVGQGVLWVLYWVVESRLSTLPFLSTHLSFLTPVRISAVVILGTLLGVIGSVTAVYRAVRRM